MKKFIKKLIARYQSSAIYRWTLGWAASSCRLADLWFLLTGSMGREHQAVLSGRYRNMMEKQNDSLSESIYTLRRNTHRLEKGLIMKPRRETFAKDYILETVKKYVLIAQTPNLDENLTRWSHDVLQEYFSVVGASTSIDAARKLFLESTQSAAPVTENGQPKRPFVRDLDLPINISIDEMLNLARRRRSCRWFKQEPVPREIIDQAMQVAAYSPSACNRQPFHFRIFDEPELAQRIGGLSLGTGGFSQNFPCLAVLVGEMNAFADDRDRHVPYIDASLAVMAFQFALEVQGVSSCCINWPDVKARERMIAKALNLKPEERVVMLLAFGFPDKSGYVPYSQKKPLTELRSFNKI